MEVPELRQDQNAEAKGDLGILTPPANRIPTDIAAYRAVFIFARYAALKGASL